jgi:hypothetical protein
MVLRGILIRRRDPARSNLFSFPTSVSPVHQVVTWLRVLRIWTGLRVPFFQPVFSRGRHHRPPTIHHTSRRRSTRLPRAELPHSQRRFLCPTDSTLSTSLWARA